MMKNRKYQNSIKLFEGIQMNCVPSIEEAKGNAYTCFHGGHLETVSKLLALWEGNHGSSVDFPYKGHVTRIFDIFLLLI